MRGLTGTWFFRSQPFILKYFRSHIGRINSSERVWGQVGVELKLHCQFDDLAIR